MNKYPRLTEKEKKLVVLMDIVGFSAKDIAEHFKRTGATITHWRQSEWFKSLRYYYVSQITEIKSGFEWDSKENQLQPKQQETTNTNNW